MRHRQSGHSWLARLARDVRGNTIALAAAAMLPLAGLIGGGVDMSRLYLTKTRLQQACDAGALAGRKAMGAGAWSANANTRALQLFTANFLGGAYGTNGLTRNFTEDNGVVTGTASVAVPMTVMRIFGMAPRALNVNCTARMEIPNTDVMFVLDITGSMNCVAGDSSCGNNGNVPASGAKITGLKVAVKCFYEALLKVNTPQVCGDDPVATTYGQSAQIRLGFMPYSVGVNVGKLLPNAYLADTWTYQSRVANTQTVQAWTLGSESAKSAWGNWGNEPNGLDDASSYSGWSTVSTNGVYIDGTYYARYPSASNSYSCTAPNSSSGGSVIGFTDVQGGTTEGLQSTTPSPPTYPSSTQTLTYAQQKQHTATAWRYVWSSYSSYNKCRLQDATFHHSIDRTATSTKPISWTSYNAFKDWTYKAVTHDVAALKAGGTTWNGSVALPLTTTNGPTVKLSGSNYNSTLTLVGNTNVAWAGCIEERQTVQNSDGDPSNEWTPIPAAAYDMNIDLIPSASVAGSYWGPRLPDAVWGRYTGSGWYTSNTTADVTTTSDLDRNTYSYCGTEAKKLQTWYTPTNFVNYVDSLHAEGNTYHDIGMVWGARFISPTGIFASENATTSTGGSIQRHIIFMTDGDTMSYNNDYMSYGISWWDRRQTTYAPSNNSGYNSDTAKIVNAHLTGLCTAIKNKNITLWVISFGGGINADTEARLSACATSGHYYSANDSAALLARFKQIASEIAELRLTS